MVEKQDTDIDTEIFEERAVYLENVDKLIFETLEVPMIDKRCLKRNVYLGVFEEIELINNIEASENIAPVGNIELTENIFQERNFLNVPGYKPNTNISPEVIKKSVDELRKSLSELEKVLPEDCKEKHLKDFKDSIEEIIEKVQKNTRI